MRKNYVYSFEQGRADGDASMKDLLGGKGANLAEMAKLGLPVPPGFTITTDACKYLLVNDTLPAGLEDEVMEALGTLTRCHGGSLGTTFLVSVRSGAKFSMPGMMDTTLNLGLNDENVEEFAKHTGNPHLAWDCYRRFLEMYGTTVFGIKRKRFLHCIKKLMNRKGITHDWQLEISDLKKLVAQFKQIIEKHGHVVPQDPHEQLWGAIRAVFGSWKSDRAIIYRNMHDIPDDLGTAANIQTMVYGNMNDRSATGVAFTRNPSTGEKGLFGEYLVNAQGEEVVAGIRTPLPVTEAACAAKDLHGHSLEVLLPKAYADLRRYAALLEGHYRDLMDLEFTIMDGVLYMLQCRAGKRTGRAAFTIAHDLVLEGVITEDDGILRVSAMQHEQILHKTIDPSATVEEIATGLPASPGAAVGEIVFSPEEAARLKELGRSVILVRIETSPEDIGGMRAAEGILTQSGGMTSHAALVARGMGKPCVCGVEALEIDYATSSFTVGGARYAAGDTITIDGSGPLVGHVYKGSVPLLKSEPTAEYLALTKWAESRRRLRVRANAETPEEAREARRLGAEGIGLSRTEHMFFGDNRITAVREMILADTTEDRRMALAKLLPMQRDDFKQIFEIMAGLPVTIRLLDPPLHEFLPHDEVGIKNVAWSLGIDVERVRKRVNSLKEFNPMLGFRGVRLAIVFPEIVEMQVRAIFEAAIEAGYSLNGETLLEIMVPLVGFQKEIEQAAIMINRVYLGTCRDDGPIVSYKIGTMIELPRACKVAHQIAQCVEFFSFGTNDLTQTTLGISRDDIKTFLESYLAQGIFDRDPFTSIDVEGVGALMKEAVEAARRVDPHFKLGICGEHGGDEKSILFFEEIGLDYVSCSPPRVPIARLAAAQAAITQGRMTATRARHSALV